MRQLAPWTGDQARETPICEHLLEADALPPGVPEPIPWGPTAGEPQRYIPSWKVRKSPDTEKLGRE